jgi:NAD(P)-dependent dehydrogenase (short-subunit alcohol dehydrogenase family)
MTSEATGAPPRATRGLLLVTGGSRGIGAACARRAALERLFAASQAGSSGTPIGRAGTPDEVAAVALWLASDEASYVTASVVSCSGGR